MFNDEDIEIIEEDGKNVSPSNTYTKNSHSTVQKKDSDNLKNTIQKNKQATPSTNNLKSESSTKSGVDNGNQFKKAGNVANISKGLSSDDPEAQKEALKGAGKEVIKPIVRKSVQAATGGAIGTDPVTGKLIDDAVDKVADNPQVDKIIDEVVEKVQKTKKKIMIPIIGGILSFFMPFFIVIVLVSTPVGLANDLSNSVQSAAIDILDFLTWNGICTSEECQTRYENRFYTVVNDYAEIYEKTCSSSMDYDLITAAIFYEQMVTEEEYDYGKAHGEFMKLSSVLYPDFFVDVSEDTNLWSQLVGDITFDQFFDAYNAIKNLLTKTEVKCVANYDNFISHLNNTYIDSNYSKLKKGDYDYYTNSIIITEIMSFSNGYTYDEEEGESTTGQTIVGTGPAGSIPQEILEVSQSPLGEYSIKQTSCYGYYDYRCGGHTGVDLTAQELSSPEIQVIADGEVFEVKTGYSQCTVQEVNGKYVCPACQSGGNSVVVKHTIENQDGTITFYSKYLHLDEVSVTYGQKLSKGDIVGTMGTTGCSTGNHLHFSMLNSSQQIYNPEELFAFLGINLNSSLDCNNLRQYCSKQ